MASKAPTTTSLAKTPVKMPTVAGQFSLINFICSVVKAELFYGAMKSKNPDKTLLKQEIFLNQFVSLPFDVFLICKLKIGRIEDFLSPSISNFFNLILKLEKTIEQPAQIVSNADALLIIVGAGMGVDSGLSDFKGGFCRILSRSFGLLLRTNPAYTHTAKISLS